MIRWRRIRWGWVVLFALAALSGWLYWRFDSATLDRVLWYGIPVALLLFIVVGANHGTRISLWTSIAFLAAASALAWIENSSYRLYTKAFLFLIAGAPLGAIANACYRADRKRAQSERDLAATRLYNDVADNAPRIGRYTLYLRPFATTERLESQSQSRMGGDLPTHLDLETLLTRALRRECPLVALGRPGEVEQGAGRISVSDAGWQEAVTRLSDKATMLLIIPSSHAGTLRELRRLREQVLLSKTLLIMPEMPRTTPSGVIQTSEGDMPFEVGFQRYDSSRHTYDIPGEWEAAVTGCEAFSVHLPADAAAGALFTIDPASGSVGRILPLALSVLMRKNAYLTSALNRLGLLPWRKPRRPSFSDDFEAAVIGGGRTLEFALTVGADAFLAWGRVDEGTEFLRRALSVVRWPKFSSQYGQIAAQFAYDCLTRRETARALPYLYAIRQLQNEFGLNPSQQQALAEAIQAAALDCQA